LSDSKNDLGKSDKIFFFAVVDTRREPIRTSRGEGEKENERDFALPLARAPVCTHSFYTQTQAFDVVVVEHYK